MREPFLFDSPIASMAGLVHRLRDDLVYAQDPPPSDEVPGLQAACRAVLDHVAQDAARLGVGPAAGAARVPGPDVAQRPDRARPRAAR